MVGNSGNTAKDIHNFPPSNAHVVDTDYKYRSLIDQIMNKYKTLLQDNIFRILSVIL